MRSPDRRRISTKAFHPHFDGGHYRALDLAYAVARREHIATEEGPTLRDIHAVPILGQQSVQILRDHALAHIGFQGCNLLLVGHSFQISSEVQRLPGFVIVKGFRPQLGHDLFNLPRPVRGFVGAGHRPEAAIARDVPEEAVVVVGASHDDTLPGMILHAVAVAVPEFVVLPGDERFHCLHVYLLKPRKLTQFENPISLQLLRGGLVLHVPECQRIGEPLATQLCKKRGFAQTLRTHQHHDAVELHAGLVHPGNGSHEHLTSDSTVVGCVEGTKIVCKDMIESLIPVPFRQCFQIVPDGMVCVFRRHGQQDAL